MKTRSIHLLLGFFVVGSALLVAQLSDASVVARMTCSGSVTDGGGVVIGLPSQTVLATDPAGYRAEVLDFLVSATLSPSGEKQIDVISTYRRHARSLGGVIGDGPNLSMKASELRGGTVNVHCRSSE